MVAVPLGAGVDLRRWGGGAGTPPAAVAPALVQMPQLAGTGRIGEPVTLQPGVWSGSPAPVLARQWLRDGLAIPGATGASYLPVAADDEASLACRVTATNAGGSAAAETAGLAVTYTAPLALGALADLVLFQGSNPQTVAAAAVFAGENLTFAVSGAGATINPATGLVSIPVAATLIAETVSVSASNSGGSAGLEFAVTVIGAPVAAEAQAWNEAADDGLRTFGTAPLFTTAADPAGATLAYGLRDGALTAEAGTFEDGVFVGQADGYVSIDPATGVLGIDTSASGPLAGVSVVVRASNAAGYGDLTITLTVAGIDAWSPAELFVAAGSAGVYLDARNDAMFQQHAGTSGLTPADAHLEPIGTVAMTTGSLTPPIYARAANGTTGRPTRWESGGDVAIEWNDTTNPRLYSAVFGTFQAGWHLFVAMRRLASSTTYNKSPIYLGPSGNYGTNYFKIGYNSTVPQIGCRFLAAGRSTVLLAGSAGILPAVGTDFVMGGFLGVNSLKGWLNGTEFASGDSLFTASDTVANVVCVMDPGPDFQTRPGRIYRALAYRAADGSEMSSTLRDQIFAYLTAQLPL